LNLHNLKELTFGENFNQPLNNSLVDLHNLRELTLGKYFNQQVVILDGITKLTLDCNSQSIIDYLPSSIEELVLGLDFNLELNDLPSSIKKIKICNTRYDKKLNNLPTGIKLLEINSKYKYVYMQKNKHKHNHKHKYIQKIDTEYKNLNIIYF